MIAFTDYELNDDGNLENDMGKCTCTTPREHQKV